MTMTPRLRKFALTAHVTASVGWLGTAVAYLGLVVAALTSQEAQVVRAAYLAMEPITWFAIVPLALASLLTGLVQSLGTPWGLFRHYWVLFKLLLTVLATIVLLGNTRTVNSLAGLAAETDSVDIAGLQGQLLHAGGGLLLLLVNATLSVYKPRGMTPYGRRKQHEPRKADPPLYPDTGVEPDRGLTTSTPRWVKVFGIIVLILVLLFVIMHLTGGRLGDHTPSGDHTPCARTPTHRA